MSYKDACCRHETGGYYTLDLGLATPARLFFTEKLFGELEESVFAQLAWAATYPGVKELVLTPDAHVGNCVPVGCVIATDGTLLMAPVGFDIGCGILCFKSEVGRVMCAVSVCKP